MPSNEINGHEVEKDRMAADFFFGGWGVGGGRASVGGRGREGIYKSYPMTDKDLRSNRHNS